MKLSAMSRKWYYSAEHEKNPAQWRAQQCERCSKADRLPRCNAQQTLRFGGALLLLENGDCPQIAGKFKKNENAQASTPDAEPINLL